MMEYHPTKLDTLDQLHAQYGGLCVDKDGTIVDPNNNSDKQKVEEKTCPALAPKTGLTDCPQINSLIDTYSHDYVIYNVPYIKHSYSDIFDGDQIGVSHGQGQLNSPQAWSAPHGCRTCWIQFDLGKVYQLSGVAIQKRKQDSQYAKSINVQISETDSENPKNIGIQDWKYKTNEADEIVPVLFASGPTKARYVRITITDYESHPSLRAGVLITVNNKKCDKTLPQLNKKAAVISKTANSSKSIKNKLVELGYSPVDEFSQTGMTLAKANTYDVIYISGKITTTAGIDTIKDTKAGIIFGETDLIGKLNLAIEGKKSNGNKIKSASGEDPAKCRSKILGRLSGNIVVYNSESPIGYGLNVSSECTVVANDVNNNPTIFAIEKGGRTTTTCAKGRRVYIFMSDNSEEALTPEGWYLFENVVKWTSNSPEHDIYKELTCPVGTTKIGGNNADISGCGLEDCNATSRFDVNSIEDCADKCKNNRNCQSFSWAPVCGDKNHPENNVCTIYNSAVSNSTHGPNQILCSSPPKPTIAPISKSRYVRIYMPKGCASSNADNWLHFEHIEIFDKNENNLLKNDSVNIYSDYCDVNNQAIGGCYETWRYKSRFINKDNLYHGSNPYYDNRFVEIDFGKDEDIGKILIKNRADCCHNRIQQGPEGAEIQLLSGNENSKKINKIFKLNSATTPDLFNSSKDSTNKKLI